MRGNTKDDIVNTAYTKDAIVNTAHIKERQREWRRALRRFKTGIRLRAKLGIIQTLCTQVAEERKGRYPWDAPQWSDDKWLTLLYVSIRNDQYPMGLLKGFVQTAEVTFYALTDQPTVEAVLKVVNDICRRRSKELRRKFGAI